MTAPEFFHELWARYRDPAKFVDTYRARMREYRISQGEVARRSGYPAPQITRWLGRNASVLPGLESMVILDEALTQLIQRSN